MIDLQFFYTEMRNAGRLLREELFGHNIQLIGHQCYVLVRLACWLLLKTISSPLLVRTLTSGHLCKPV
jgi:hypothetical protein